MKPFQKEMEQTYNRGMESLFVGETTIGKIEGKEGKLWYRGFDAEELAKVSNFEEVSYLLIHGDLPTKSQYDRWCKEFELWHEPPDSSLKVLEYLPTETHALKLYRTMLTIAACHIPEGENTRIEAQWRRPALILAWCSTIAAAAICHILGKEGKPYNPDKSFSANFLAQALGKEPTDDELKAFDVSLIVQAEDGVHAAALAALTVISTRADLGSAVLAGMGALSGDLQGGASQFAFQNLVQLKSVEEAREWVDQKLNERYRFPGFGHRNYKTFDPRVRILEPFAEKLLTKNGDPHLWDIYRVIKEKVESTLGSKGVYLNVDGITGLIYHALGFPPESFSIPFALAIQTGWMAHCLEYLSEGKMFEPGAIYTG